MMHINYVSIVQAACTILVAVTASTAWTIPDTQTAVRIVTNANFVPSKRTSNAALVKRSTMHATPQDSVTTEDGATSSSTSTGFCTIIGAGRIGSLLASTGSKDDTLVLKRGDSIPSDGSGPILIATRNDSLDDIIDSCPQNRIPDLVFLQNGYLDRFLASKGVLDVTSQALLYFSVPSLGANPIDGVTSLNPEGLTAATGKHAQAFADRLAALDLKCRVVDWGAYRPAMLEKLIWISTFMLVGTVKGCKSVGQAGTDHADLIETVVKELVSAAGAREQISFSSGVLDRLQAYTNLVKDFPVGVKEFEWRNQYFYNLGDDVVPVHNGLLNECAEKGLLNFKLF